MRTPGPVNPSLRLVDPSAGRGKVPEAGALVFVAVREKLGSEGGTELYRISLGSRSLTALSSARLEPGTTLKARVERSGDAISLRILPPDRAGGAAREAAQAALSAAGLPNDQAARAALGALLREGAAPEARALSRVRRAALLEGEGGGRKTELAAMMEAKGLPAESESIEAIAEALSGGGRDGAEGGWRGEDSPGGGHREGRGEPRLGPLEPGFGLERDLELEIPEDDLSRALAGLFRAMALRVGEDGGKLAVFNQLRGPEGSWVLVPFRFSLDEVAFAGSFRIQLPYVLGGPGRFEARFTASRGSIPGAAMEEWSLFSSFGGGGPASLILLAPEGKAGLARSRIAALEASLAELGCRLRLRGAQGTSPLDAGLEGLDLDA
jgi:hypothetical protein